MPRKAISPQNELNPLQRMFGTFLRMERTRLGLSSRKVADELKVTDTYLRLAEAGRAALNQSLAFKIIGLFADSSAQTHEFRTISFTRLALFMVGMHWVGAEMAASGQNGKHVVEDLAARASDFQVLLERTNKYFELAEPDQKKFLEEIASPAVGEFVRSERYGRDDIGSLEENILPRSELLNLPTLNIYLLLALKNELKGRAFAHTAEIAAEWESQHRSDFRSVRGLYIREDLIMDPDNLNLFHYEYLAEKRFVELQMIFVTEKKEKELREGLIRGINRGRSRKSNLPPLTEEEIKKVHVRGLSRERVRKYQNPLDSLRRGGRTNEVVPKLYGAYWSFETHSDLHIGFVGVLDNNAYNTRNLNLRDSLQKTSTFQELWRNMDADR